MTRLMVQKKIISKELGERNPKISKTIINKSIPTEEDHKPRTNKHTHEQNNQTHKARYPSQHPAPKPSLTKPKPSHKSSQSASSWRGWPAATPRAREFAKPDEYAIDTPSEQVLLHVSHSAVSLFLSFLVCSFIYRILALILGGGDGGVTVLS